MTRTPTTLCLLLPLLWPGMGWAARDKVSDRLQVVDVAVGALTASVESLERQVAPGRGFITEQDAIARFEDYVYLHMVGEHALAAEGFFTLVTTASLSDAGLHRDAEWYLAESLFLMGNVSTAEARYLVIADNGAHPFRDDAVRRLLELYALSGQAEEFGAVYQREIVEGRVQPTDLITYSLAKSFYFQDRLDEAVSQFQGVPLDSPFYARAQYFLGTIEVVRGNLEAALGDFAIAAEQGVVEPEDREVRDLSLLALARVHYELGHLSEAADFYGKVGGDSPYLADKLYEVIWTFIKQEEYRAALDGVEIFLLRFPEHEYTAQLRLLDAHLRLEQKEFDSALTSYSAVAKDYEPIRVRFASLAGSKDEPRQYFQQILAAVEGQQSEEDSLPPYAVAMMVHDEGLSEAIGIYQEIVVQQAQIAESELLIDDLEAVLDSSAGIGGYDRLRYLVLLDHGRATDNQLALLALEEEWLEEKGSADVTRALLDLRRQRLELVALVGSVPVDQGTRVAMAAREAHVAAKQAVAAEAEALRKAIEADAATRAEPEGDAVPVDGSKAPEPPEDARLAELALLEAELARLDAEGPSTDWEGDLAQHDAEIAVRIQAVREGLRGQRGGLDGAAVFEDLDRLHTILERDQERLGALRAKLTSSESSELGRIRARFEHEVREVAAQRLELSDSLSEAEQVSLALTRAGFRRLEDFFADSVMRADMGVVDVYWSQKVDVAEQRQRMAEEKSQLLSDLDARFELIRNKLGQ